MKKLIDAWNTPRINLQMNLGMQALQNEEFEVAHLRFRKATKILLRTTLHRSLTNDYMLTWGLYAHQLREAGYDELAEGCTKVSELMQARLNVGDYYE